MLSRIIKVQLPRGLQARHTTIFVRKANSFNSKVLLKKNMKIVNGKDLMEVMELAVIEGDEITLIVDGLDEKMATGTLASFLLYDK